MRNIETEVKKIVAKYRPTAMNLTSSVAASSSAENSPIASRSLGIPKASSRQVWSSGKLVAASANQKTNSDAASSSQGWQRDAQLFFNTGKLVATNTDQNDDE